LVKLGYVNSLADAKQMSAREVLQIFSYEAFCDDYERAWIAENRGT
jgi:hypothetical protein